MNKRMYRRGKANVRTEEYVVADCYGSAIQYGKVEVGVAAYLRIVASSPSLGSYIIPFSIFSCSVISSPCCGANAAYLFVAVAFIRQKMPQRV